MRPVELLEIRKIGEWYVVRGVGSNGRLVSVDVHASEVDGRPESVARERFRRAVDLVARAEEEITHEVTP